MSLHRIADSSGQLREVTILRRAAPPARAPRLSIVVPSYDTARFVAATLASLLAQTVRDLEVVVVDDGSRDDSLAVLSRIDDPRLTVVRQANRGLAGARNTGLLLARAPYVGFCDADDLWAPQKAERHLAALAASPEVGLTFSWSAYLYEDGRPSGRYLLSRCPTPSALALIRRNHVGNGSTVVARAELFRQAGLFDETLGSCEDIEMWVRGAACTAYSLRLVPEVLTAYRVRAGSMSTTYDAFLRGYRRAQERWREYVPGFTPRVAARSYAECLRIASRKAFEDGQIELSRRLLVDALRHWPGLPLGDVRALGMVALHLAALPLPAAAQARLYGTGGRVLGGVVRAAGVGGRCGDADWSMLPLSRAGEGRVRAV